MSKHNHNPQWHEPVSRLEIETDYSLEDKTLENTIEVGQVDFVDSAADKEAPGHEMPGKVQEKIQNLKDKAQDIKDKAQDVTQKITEKASEVKATRTSGLSGAVGKLGTAGAAKAQSAGTALWTLIQRNPLQALSVIGSTYWLLQNNKVTASQPPVSLTDAAEKVGSVAGSVQAAAGNLKDQVQDHAKHGAGWFGRTLQSNPLAIGAMALVFGAGLGFAVPETSYEDKLLGKTCDTLAGKATEAATDLGHKVQSVAQTAVHGAIKF